MYDMKKKILRILSDYQFTITTESGNSMTLIENDDFNDIADEIIDKVINRPIDNKIPKASVVRKYAALMKPEDFTEWYYEIFNNVNQ